MIYNVYSHLPKTKQIKIKLHLDDFLQVRIYCKIYHKTYNNDIKFIRIQNTFDK